MPQRETSPIGVRRILDASTTHITEQDDQRLRSLVEKPANREEPVYGFRVIGHNYGYIVSVPGEPDILRSKGRECVSLGLSQSFVRLVRYASKLDCDWVYLDRDGQILPDLEAFSW